MPNRRRPSAAPARAIEDDNAFNVEEGKKAADNGAAIYGATKLLVYTALVVAAALCAVLGWLLVRGVSTPIQDITAAMSGLPGTISRRRSQASAARTRSAPWPAPSKSSRDSMTTADRLAEQQHAEQAQKERRAARIEAINAEFDRDAARALDVLATAADELRNTSGKMSNNADLASKQAGAVSAAAEEASANVQTVASAAEELSASIQEISRQVVQSSLIAGQAVTEAEHTTATHAQPVRG
ncbi:MAG: hypothetical protein WDN69_06665 [Aliidongia sp.]